MSTEKNPFVASVAVYQSIRYGFTHVAMFMGEDDAKCHADYVRISEPMAVNFQPLTSDEAIQNAVATLDAAEQKERDHCNRRIAEIREQKSRLLALTYTSAP